MVLLRFPLNVAGDSPAVRNYPTGRRPSGPHRSDVRFLGFVLDGFKGSSDFVTPHAQQRRGRSF